MQAARAQNSSNASALAQFQMSMAAQQQAVKLLLQQQVHEQASNELGMLTQNVVVNIDHTLRRIDELRSLQQHKDKLIMAYNGTIPQVLATDIDLKIQQGYVALSKLIQFANTSIVHFNNSPAARVPRLLNIVSVKRHQLNIRLEALKNHRPAGMATPPPSTSTLGKAQNDSKTKAQQEVGSKASGISSTTLTVKNHSVQHSAGVTEHQPATSHQKPAGQEQQLETRAQSSGVVRGASGASEPGRINSIDHIRDKIRKRLTDDSKEREMRKTAKILLVEKTKAPADSTSPTSAKK